MVRGTRMAPRQAATVSRLCENVSGEWRDLLSRKVFSDLPFQSAEVVGKSTLADWKSNRTLRRILGET